MSDAWPQTPKPLQITTVQGCLHFLAVQQAPSLMEEEQKQGGLKVEQLGQGRARFSWLEEA